MSSIIAAIIGGVFSLYVAKYRHDLKMKEIKTENSIENKTVGATKYDLILYILELVVVVFLIYFLYYKFFWQMILQPVINYFS